MNTSRICSRVAVFDVDGTLIRDNIGVTLVKFLNRRKKIKPIPKLVIIVLYSLYKIRLLDFYYAILLGAWALKGHSIETIKEEAQSCFDSDIKGLIYQDGIEEIKKMRSAGFHIILATGAHEAIARIFCRYVDAHEIVCTTSKVVNGKYTWTVLKPIPYKEEKVALVRNIIQQSFPDAEITVYTDEKKDMPLIQLADHPVAVNADEVIVQYVRTKNGRITEFK